jgi:hypothetical protein
MFLYAAHTSRLGHERRVAKGLNYPTARHLIRSSARTPETEPRRRPRRFLIRTLLLADGARCCYTPPASAAGHFASCSLQIIGRFRMVLISSRSWCAVVRELKEGGAYGGFWVGGRGEETQPDGERGAVLQRPEREHRGSIRWSVEEHEGGTTQGSLGVGSGKEQAAWHRGS